MAKKKSAPKKAKTSKPKQPKPSQVEKAQKAFPVAKEFQKVIDGKEGYRVL